MGKNLKLCCAVAALKLGIVINSPSISEAKTAARTAFASRDYVNVLDKGYHPELALVILPAVVHGFAGRGGGGVVPPSVYQGQVFSGCRWPLFAATDKFWFNSQSPHFALDSGTRVKIGLPGGYADETVAAPGATTYSGAFLSAAGAVLGVFQFSGSNTGSCAVGAVLESDWLNVAYVKGTKYLIRLWGNGPSGLVYYQCPVGNSDTSNGAVYENSATILTDKTQGGTISPASFANSMCPISVIGDTILASSLDIGDSLTCEGAATKGDSFDGTSPYVGFPDRSLGALGIASINCGYPGETAANFAAHHTVRAQLAVYTSHVWSNYGINGPSTYAQLQAVWALFPTKRVVQGIVGYEVDSTDSFATPLNQTPKVNYGVGQAIDTLNASIAASTPSQIFAVTNGLGAAYDLTTHKWLVDGTAFKYTPDGTHYSQFGAKAVAASGLITAAKFSRAGL